jgi:hypothetical protein
VAAVAAALTLAAWKMLQVLQLLQLRLDPFCHIYNDWWLLQDHRAMDYAEYAAKAAQAAKMRWAVVKLHRWQQ